MRGRKLLGFCLFAAVAAGLAFLTPKIGGLILVHNQCSYCHVSHTATGVEQLQKEVDVENTCLSCHGPGGSSTLKAAVHEGTYKGIPFRHSCLDCHDSHNSQQNLLGSDNIKLVLALVDTPNSGPDWDVIFISRGTSVGEPAQYSFADGDSFYDGICEVCHTRTKFHRNNDSGGHKHQKGKTCTRCHSHTRGFLRN